MPGSKNMGTGSDAHLLLDSSTLPPDCVQQMQEYLGARRIVAQEADGGHEGTVMGVWSRVDCEGLGADSTLVVVAARPQGDAPWNFGDCFPRLPGAWGDSIAVELFRMRSLTLNKALWLFVWGRHIEPGMVRDRVASTKWFKEWAVQREVADTSAPGLKAFFDTLGFDARELQAAPQGGGSLDHGVIEADSGAGEATGSRGGLFLWGDVAQTTLISLTSPSEGMPAGIGSPDINTLSDSERKVEALALFSELDQFLSGAKVLLFAKARVKHEEGFPHLDLQLPPKSREFGGPALEFRDAGVYFSSPIYFSQKDTRVGVRGDFVFKDKHIHVDLEYPIDGDIIRASGKYTGGPDHFLGDSASFGFPESGPSFPNDDEIELELEFSKSEKTLTKLNFTLEMHGKKWQLIPAPVALALEGVSFHVTIFDPLGDNAVVARIAAEAAFGEEGDGQFHLTCGGSYPSGQLFLQSRESLPVGSLIEKLVGPSAGLEKLKFDDLRIEYNYQAEWFALAMVVNGPWEIAEGFEIEDIRFRVEGTEPRIGSLEATLEIEPVPVHLSALYDQGWDISGRAENLPMRKLIEWMAKQIDDRITLPDELRDFTIENLGLQYRSKTKFLQFTCKGKLTLDHTHESLAEITVTRQAETAKNPKAAIEFGGHLTIAGRKFDLSCHNEAGSSRMVMSYRSDGVGIELRSLVDGELGQQIPEGLTIKFKELYLAYASQSGKAEATGKSGAASAFSGFLLGADLEASIRLSDIPLAGASLPAGFDAGVDKLRIVLASHDFLTSNIAGINEDLPEGIAKLALVSDPAETKPPGVDSLVIGKGFNLSAELKLGEVQRTINLNTASSSKSAQPVGASSKTKAIAHAEGPATLDSRSVVSASAGGVASPQDTSGTGGTWLTLDKKIGPVEFHRIGLQYQNNALWVLLDVAFSSSGLTLSLDGLGVGSPLSEFKPKFKLAGIGLDYTGGGAVEIGGSFLHQQLPDAAGKLFDQYSGAALIKTEALKLSAMGSYAEVDGYTSMFVYAFLDKPLGGPSFFFVTGLAAAFGYNRALKSPTRVEEVESFPLVSIAIGRHPVADTRDETSALLAILSSLGNYLPPAPNKCFLALGVKFNSFKLIDSFALLVVTFGDEFLLKLLGLSKIVAPPTSSGKPPVAEVTIGLLAEFIPGDGLLKVDGKIMPGSYVFDHACQLTGGFAFYSWFSGPHSGDFVLSVGGYHPRFLVPAHYPSIERLALNWQVDPELSVKGTTYFALTPSAVMAGGVLEARLDQGNLQAWFDLNADFLISWQPFYYDIAVSIEIGASYHTFLGTVSASLGAAVHIWGPEFAGTANVYFVFVSFDVSFGATGLQKPPPLTWTEFKTAFLPVDKDVCTITVKDGLLRTIKDSPDPLAAPADIKRWCILKNGSPAEPGASEVIAPEAPPSSERWIINPKHFALAIDSIIPVNRVGLNGTLADRSDGVLGIGSMDVSDFESTLNLMALRRNPATGKFSDCCYTDFVFAPVLKSVPSAIWGKQPEPDLNGKPIPDVVCGFEVRPKGHPDPGNTEDIKCSVLRYDRDYATPEIAWQRPGRPPVQCEGATPNELKASLDRRRALHALLPDDDGDDPFDIELDQRLIDEFLDAPQLTATPGG